MKTIKNWLLLEKRIVCDKYKNQLTIMTKILQTNNRFLSCNQKNEKSDFDNWLEFLTVITLELLQYTNFFCDLSFSS